jgi:hypothetical protein
VNEKKIFKAITEYIRDIFEIAKDREDWYLDTKINDRLLWIKKLERCVSFGLVNTVVNRILTITTIVKGVLEKEKND